MQYGGVGKILTGVGKLAVKGYDAVKDSTTTMAKEGGVMEGGVKEGVVKGLDVTKQGVEAKVNSIY